MGTAQQEIPVATLNTVHTLQVTTEELRLLAHAMRFINRRNPYYPDESKTLRKPSEEMVALEELLDIFLPLED